MVDWLLLIASALIWLVPALIIRRIAIRKGLSGFGFTVAGLMCWPIALLLVAVTPRQVA
jgi:hypothetical protein